MQNKRLYPWHGVRCPLNITGGWYLSTPVLGGYHSASAWELRAYEPFQERRTGKTISLRSTGSLGFVIKDHVQSSKQEVKPEFFVPDHKHSKGLMTSHTVPKHCYVHLQIKQIGRLNQGVRWNTVLISSLSNAVQFLHTGNRPHPFHIILSYNSVKHVPPAQGEMSTRKSQKVPTEVTMLSVTIGAAVTCASKSRKQPLA